MAHTATQKNIIITLLLQTIGKLSTESAQEFELEKQLLHFRTAVQELNNAAETTPTVNPDITPEDAKHELFQVDQLYTMFDGFFGLLFEGLTKAQKAYIYPDYSRLIDNLEDLREALQLHANPEYRETMRKIAAKDYTDFVNVA